MTARPPAGKQDEALRALDDLVTGLLGFVAHVVPELRRILSAPAVVPSHPLPPAAPVVVPAPAVVPQQAAGGGAPMKCRAYFLLRKGSAGRRPSTGLRSATRC